MNSSLWLLRLLMVYSTVISIYSTKHDPLIFNPRTLEICDLRDEDNSNDSKSLICAVACRANDDSERNVENFYQGYQFLFIQQFIDVFQQQDTNKMKCDRRIELSVLLHSKKGGELVEFGFQVFYEKSKFQGEEIVSNDINKFKEVETREYDTLDRAMFTLQKAQLPVPWKNEKSKMNAKWGFVWVSKIEVRYNFSSRILTSLRYKVRPIKSDQLKVTCQNYSKYTVRYNTNEHLDKLYSYASSPDTVSCSNITSIPLWNDIPDAFMDRLQMFLIAIAQVLGKEHELIVLPGVLGQLTLPSITDDKPVKIYLNAEERKVPVPKIIYKLVRHRTYKCNEKKGKLCWFDVIIVIHNYPTITTKEKLCPTDECERLGWGSIQHLNSDGNPEEGKLPFVYCCELTKVTAKSIGFSLGKTMNERLSLKYFYTYDHSDQRHYTRDILGDVLVEFKKLIDAKQESVESEEPKGPQNSFG